MNKNMPNKLKSVPIIAFFNDRISSPKVAINAWKCLIKPIYDKLHPDLIFPKTIASAENQPHKENF